MPTEFDREAFYELAKSTFVKCLDLTTQVRRHAGDYVIIEFNRYFKFRVIDKTDLSTVRDYGWFGTLDEVRLKLDRMYPLAGFMD